jgi:HEAT repeat protein
VQAVREVSGLGFGRAGESIRLLVPVLTDSDPGVRAAAAESLGLLGANAIGVGTDSEDVRAAAAALIGLVKDPSAKVRTAVATSLGMIVTAAAAPRPPGRNPGAAKKASAPAVDIDAVGDALVGVLSDQEAPVRQAAISGLGALAAKGAGTRDGARPARPGANAVDGPPPGLVKALDDETAPNRAAAATALAGYRRGLDPAIRPLLRLLDDDDVSVREASAWALGRIRPPAITAAAEPALIAGLGIRDRSAREHVVQLLTRLKPDPRAAVPALVAVLREPIDSDMKVVEPSVIVYDSYSGPAHSAAHALGEIAPGTPQAGEAMAALNEVVRSGPVQRRGSAAEALGAFGPAAATSVPFLIAMLKEAGAAKVPTRAGGLAAGALGKIAPGTPAADAALAALIAALRDPWIPTREAALRALPAFGPKAAPALPAIRELNEKDPEPEVRKAAEAALVKIKPGSE